MNSLANQSYNGTIPFIFNSFLTLLSKTYFVSLRIYISMKKFAAIFLTTFYLLATVGVAFSVHFCDGQVDTINVYAKASDCCCGDENSMADCCDDEQFFFQLDSEQKVNQNLRVNTEKLISSFSYLVFTKILTDSEEEIIISEELNHSHPYKQPIRLLQCSLTYYG